MAQHRWNRRFMQDADAAPDNLFYFEPDLVRRRRYAERKREQARAEEIDRSGSARHLERAAKRLKQEDENPLLPQPDPASVSKIIPAPEALTAVSSQRSADCSLIAALTPPPL